jgi:PTH1 family peptidyl-tRNA hydrolase
VWAVVGLGNPGRRYEDSRHNAGFTLIRRVAKSWDVRVRKRRFLSKTAEVRRDSERVVLAMPQTFMNASGQAVRQILAGLDIEPARLLVVYDDVDIPLGEVRIRKEGGPGTHRGMLSIVQEIETTRFPRIRIGVGPAGDDIDIVAFVLSPFRRGEKALFEEGLDKAREALEIIIAGRFDQAMNSYN